jgi:hypothetical protein
MLLARLGNYKYGFSELEDALAFYTTLAEQNEYAFLTATHIVKGKVWEEIPEQYFVNVISTEDKDSEAYFLSELAFKFRSFGGSGCKDKRIEFDYLPGYKIIKHRDPETLRKFHRKDII